MLTNRLEELVPKQRAHITELRKQYGNKVIGDVTVNQVIGGMRGIPALLTEVATVYMMICAFLMLFFIDFAAGRR